jgi:hypothetical protein
MARADIVGKVAKTGRIRIQFREGSWMFEDVTLDGLEQSVEQGEVWLDGTELKSGSTVRAAGFSDPLPRLAASWDEWRVGDQLRIVNYDGEPNATSDGGDLHLADDTPVRVAAVTIGQYVDVDVLTGPSVGSPEAGGPGRGSDADVDVLTGPSVGSRARMRSPMTTLAFP